MQWVMLHIFLIFHSVFLTRHTDVRVIKTHNVPLNPSDTLSYISICCEPKTMKARAVNAEQDH